jgi:hypothetical protein
MAKQQVIIMVTLHRATSPPMSRTESFEEAIASYAGGVCELVGRGCAAGKGDIGSSYDIRPDCRR